SRIAIKSSASLESLARDIGDALGLDFEAHGSSFWGDPYFLARDSEGHEVHLTENVDPTHREGIDPPEDRFFLPDHGEFPVVLWVDAPTSDSSEVASRLEAVLAVECIGLSDP